jgi:hypothetical protein
VPCECSQPARLEDFLFQRRIESHGLIKGLSVSRIVTSLLYMHWMIL